MKRLYLDVDGVVNAVPRSPEDLVGSWDEWHLAKCMGFWITYSPDMGRRLFELATAAGMEIVWLTTWGRRANQWIAPLFGWPRFTVLAEPGDELSRIGWWKFDCIYRLHNYEPFVWIDDDLASERDAYLWCVENGGLPISPASETGITPGHLDEIEAWLRRMEV